MVRMYNRQYCLYFGDEVMSPAPNIFFPSKKAAQDYLENNVPERGYNTGALILKLRGDCFRLHSIKKHNTLMWQKKKGTYLPIPQDGEEDGDLMERALNI